MTSVATPVPTFALTFSQDSPPPGWRDDEPMETALKRLGDVMILKVPVVGVLGVELIANESNFPHDQIIKNVSIFVANDIIENDRFVLYLKAGPIYNKIIKSDHLMIKDDDNPKNNKRRAPVVEGVEIGILPPDKHIHLELIMGVGTGETRGSNFSVVTTYTFYEVKPGVFMFKYELVKGFTDGNYVYDEARKALLEHKSFDPDEYEALLFNAV